ncbi:MAG TPA: PDZ domain-containing protein [Phycisphaerae bacterium]|nr:PDZ domain-containing protein [Phycisphaerae bacterium]HRR85115.1 PDZ domain-containing protein [Phycisphaerae bacterium]
MATAVSLLLTAVLWTRSAPASAPAAVVDGEIVRLIRDLNHPQPARRKAAAERLTELGDAAEEPLEKALPDQPAEARIAITGILKDIRLSRRGALVLLVFPRGQAWYGGVRPGDVLLAVDGEAISDVEAWSKAEETRFRNRARTVRLRRDKRVYDRKFREGKYGIQWCMYQSGWGDHLAEAAREHDVGNYAAAVAAIEKAIEAGNELGVDVEAVQGTLGLITRCRYYALPPAERPAYLDMILKKPPYINHLAAIIGFATSLNPEDLHLHDEICRRIIRGGDMVEWAHDQLTYRLVFKERRYAEALVELLNPARAGEKRRPEDQAHALHKLATCLDALGADAELSVVLDRLAAFPQGRVRFGWLFPAAVRIGRLKLCEDVLPQIPEGSDAEGEQAYWEYIHAKDRLYQVYLRQGQVDDFRRALARGLADLGFAQDARLYSAWWPKTADLWARHAEEELKYAPAMNLDYLLSALAFQVDPNVAKLEKAIEFCEAAQRNRLTPSFHRARLEALKGNYAASLDWYEKIRAYDQENKPWNKPWDILPETEAVRFLSEHAKDLTGQDEKWRRVLYAYKTDDGTRYLITRDIRIGKASPDGRVTEIPLPEPGWWPYRLADGLIVSDSGRTVLAVSREQVYQLQPDAAGWSLLMHIPFSQRGWAIHKYAPWADELAAELRSHPPQARSIVLPEEFPDHNNNAPIEPVMLGDGTWLYCEAKPHRMFNLSTMLARQLGRQVQIYSIFRSSRAGVLYLGTERGLYRWVPGEDRCEPMPLPGQNPAPPVRIVVKQLPYPDDFQPFAAVLPSAGGAMFLIDTKTQQVTPTPCVNELLSASYWSSRSPADRIAEAKATLVAARLDWDVLRLAASRPVE